MEENSVRRAIHHLADLGDTDIFPTLFEFSFYRDCIDAVVQKAIKVQGGSYTPVGAVEILSPKTQTSFRIAHQLYATDSLFYTAAAIELAPAIEALRLPIEEGAFSYRFSEDQPEVAALFADGCSFHDWLMQTSDLCKPDSPFDTVPLVLETDISDFYSRIYFHRIEHLLDDTKAKNSDRKIIENVIKASRARQSYGIPVGCAASRIIAEGVLIDIDKMLKRDGLKFTRYVDDFKIFVPGPEAAHSALCRLAEHLMLTEGLSLNAAKTRIVPASVIADEVESKFSDVFTADERKALDKYIQSIYDGEDITDAVIGDVDAEKLYEKLITIVRSEVIDYTSVKLILKALRAIGLTHPLNLAIDLPQLLYFVPRDFCILIGSLAQRDPEVAQGLADQLISLSLDKPYAEMTLIRVWVNHLFVAGALPITEARFSQLGFRNTPLEGRQRILLKGRLEDRSYFREAKTQFANMNAWEKPALMLAASCLPTSEFETWLGFCKERYSDLLGDEYIGWLKANRETLFEKLDQNFVLKSREQQISEIFASMATLGPLSFFPSEG